LRICNIGQVPAKLHRIKLSGDERLELEAIRDHKGAKMGKRAKAGKAMDALSLLLTDEGADGPGLKDAEITRITGLSVRTIERLRKRCCEVGPLAALERKPRETPPQTVRITGEVQARITQLACSKPPVGHARWTLHLLADRLVEIKVIERISHTSVGTVLKKANSSPGGSKAGASRPSKTPHS
jgi:transposase